MNFIHYFKIFEKLNPDYFDKNNSPGCPRIICLI